MIEAVRTFIEQLPKIISEAAKSALGVIALMVLALSVLSLFLFNQASDEIKVLIYILTAVSFFIFVGVVLRVAGPSNSSHPAIKESKNVEKAAYHHISIVVHEEGDETVGLEGATTTLSLSPEPQERVSDAKGNIIFFFSSSLDGTEVKLNARKKGYQVRMPETVTLGDGVRIFFPLKPDNKVVNSDQLIGSSGEIVDLPRFDVPTVQQYAREGRLEEWIHAYLNRPEKRAIPALSIGLKRARRWWNGPLEIKLADLNRCEGPEEYMEYQVDPFSWTKFTTELAKTLSQPLSMPPLIVHCETGFYLSIRDGNGRHEAMRLKGWLTCWVVIWYDTVEDYRRHTKHLIAAGYVVDQSQA